MRFDIATTTCSDRGIHQPTDKILEETRGEFQLESIAGMRHDDSMDAFIDFLGMTIKVVVGYSKYKENRITRPFSEWCAHTDEAFLIFTWRHTGESGNMSAGGYRNTDNQVILINLTRKDLNGCTLQQVRG